jgi:MFS family permease
MLLVTQSWMLFAAGALGGLALAHHVGPWTLLLATFALGLGSAANGPAWQAMIPDLVPREDLPSAVALNSVQFNMARAVGPALAGVVLAATSPGVVFLVNAVSFLGVIIVLWRQAVEPGSQSKPQASFTAALKEGTLYVAESHAFRTVLLRQGSFVMAGSALWALLPVVSSHEMKGTALGYGILLGCLGAGAVIGAAVLPPLRAAYSNDKVAVSGTILFALASFGLASLRSFWPLAIAMLAGGVAWMTTMSTFNVFAQTTAPGWVKARALAFYLLTFQASIAIGSSIWGAVAERIGTREAMYVAGVTLLAGLGLTLKWPLLAQPAREELHVT